MTLEHDGGVLDIFFQCERGFCHLSIWFSTHVPVLVLAHQKQGQEDAWVCTGAPNP